MEKVDSSLGELKQLILGLQMASKEDANSTKVDSRLIENGDANSHLHSTKSEPLFQCLEHVTNIQPPPFNSSFGFHTTMPLYADTSATTLALPPPPFTPPASQFLYTPPVYSTIPTTFPPIQQPSSNGPYTTHFSAPQWHSTLLPFNHQFTLHPYTY